MVDSKEFYSNVIWNLNIETYYADSKKFFRNGAFTRVTGSVFIYLFIYKVRLGF